jgi:hypothetical protein
VHLDLYYDQNSLIFKIILNSKSFSNWKVFCKIGKDLLFENWLWVESSKSVAASPTGFSYFIIFTGPSQDFFSASRAAHTGPATVTDSGQPAPSQSSLRYGSGSSAVAPATAERGHCSKQSKAFVLDRAVEIHPNVAHCSTFQKILFTAYSKFTVLYRSLDLSHRISIGRLRGGQIHGTVATVVKLRGSHSLRYRTELNLGIHPLSIYFLNIASCLPIGDKNR